MERFSSVAVIKHPVEVVWATVRDRLADVAPLLDDVESITVVERRETPDGVVHLVNLWKAKAQIPSALAKMVPPSSLAWIDRAEWQPHSRECHWRIEPRFFADRLRCSGVTRYEPALGGRGTRTTFTGTLDLDLHGVRGVAGFLEGAARRAAESFATTLVPRNFRKLIDALAVFLGPPDAAAPRGRPGRP